MNFCTPGDCFSLAHPYFTAFCAACLRYAVLTMTCVWFGGVKYKYQSVSLRRVFVFLD
jgi:hypothetical protein